jgi:hypothetical protein
VAGTVWDASAQLPIDGAAVKLVGPTPNDWRAVAAPQGRFQFDNLPAGAYFVEAAHDGYAPSGEWITVTPGFGPSVNLSLSPGMACAFNVANRTPWRIEVYVAGYAYSPMEVMPWSGVVFPGNPSGPTNIMAEADFMNRSPLNWGPYVYGCDGLQTLPLAPPPPEPVMDTMPSYSPPPPPPYE